jgi:hypothetical protein
LLEELSRKSLLPSGDSECGGPGPAASHQSLVARRLVRSSFSSGREAKVAEARTGSLRDAEETLPISQDQLPALITLIRRGRLRLAAPSFHRASVSLRLDAIDPDHAEAGVFTANLSYILLLFVFECLGRVHIAEL